MNNATAFGECTRHTKSVAGSHFVAIEELEPRELLAFGAFEPSGPEIQVSTSTAGLLPRPAVAIDVEGNSVVVWTAPGLDGSGKGIFAQRFDAAGGRIGQEFQVNSYTTSDQHNPAIAMDRDGNFVVVWNSWNQDGNSAGIYAQRYNSAGIPQGSEFRVNLQTVHLPDRPSIAMDTDGNFVIAYTGFYFDSRLDDIFFQRYEGNGAALGDPIRANPFASRGQSSPTVALNDEGLIVVAWTDFSSRSAYARRFDWTGTPLSDEFQVLDHTFGIRETPVAAMAADGSFVIAAVDSSIDLSYGISAQRFDGLGAALGDPFAVNTYTANEQSHPSIAMKSDGSFIVTWDSWLQDGSGTGVYAQEFGPNGARRGTEWRVNTTTEGSQNASAVALNDAGGIIAWVTPLGFFAQLLRLGAPPLETQIDPVAPVFEGDSLYLSAFATSSAPGEVQFSWDLNQDGIFDDAIGATPTLTWQQLALLGIDDSGTYVTQVRAQDSAGNVGYSQYTNWVITNVAPTVQVIFPQLGLRDDGGNGHAVQGQDAVYTLLAEDVSQADQSADFAFHIDWTGDNVVDQIVVGPSGTQVRHVVEYAVFFPVNIFVRDKDGGTSGQVRQYLKITDWDLQQDDSDPSKTNLVIGGTYGNDGIGFVNGLMITQVLNGQYFPFPRVTPLTSYNGALVVYAQDGDDYLFADAFGRRVSMFGGSGNDILVGGTSGDWLDGGADHDILFGGTLGTDGADVLIGGDGADLLIGHLGGDSLFGGAGSDILIGGSIPINSNTPSAVYSIQSEWRSNRSLQQRVANISGSGSPPRNNGNHFLLAGSTVLDEQTIDHFWGESGQDWFFLSLDESMTNDAALEDVRTDLI